MLQGLREQRLTFEAMPAVCSGPGIDRPVAPRRCVAASVKECRHPQLQIVAVAARIAEKLALQIIEALPHDADPPKRAGHHDFDKALSGRNAGPTGQQPPRAIFERGHGLTPPNADLRPTSQPPRNPR